jgi:hypothetical protein
METPRRIQEQQLANTHMTNLRVTSDVGQALPNGWYVEAHKPTVIKVHGYQVPMVMEQVRTEEEQRHLDEAEKEFKIRLERYRAGIDDPKLKAEAEETFPESPQSVAHQRHSDEVIHPLLMVEQEYACPACEDLFYSANGAGCPKCSEQGNAVTLPPPKQLEQYNQTNVIIDRLQAEVLPGIAEMVSNALMPIFVETIKHSANVAVEQALEDKTKPGGKPGRK